MFEISVSTVSRLLKRYNIQKTKEQRLANVSKTKQNKTDAEKAIYSKHVSEGRKGKGLGVEPWNKGTKGICKAWNKGLETSQEIKDKISATKRNKSEEEKRLIEEKRKNSRGDYTPWNKGIHTGKWSDELKTQALKKQYITKKANCSFNSSLPEEIFYKKLIKKYGENDVIRQYSTDARYPYNCDFYIKSIDLFIELNLSWTHGGHLFTGSQEDLNKLAIWKEKAKTSAYYQNAIETWTVRDVKKAEVAKKFNLNYLTIYSEGELYD